jgi:LuxR family maltose regulon positive regulatory protein
MRGETVAQVAHLLPRYSAAKFAPPQRISQVIDRPNLTALVDQGVETGLCLVLGSAGSGKTNVLVQWFETRPPAAACWLNVDEGDESPVRFVQAVIQAVDECRPGFGREARELIDRNGTTGRDVLEALVDEFAVLDAPIVLVIDDLHLSNGAVDRSLGQLIARRPPTLRLVIGSRAEPTFDLGRLRAADALVEIRDRDLLLNRNECRELLERLAVTLDDSTLELLWRRTEGWAAGVHLAGVALSTSAEPVAFVDRLVASSWAISHYLTSEVLAAQPPEVVDFMLDTSVVDELTPELASRLSSGSSIELADVEAAHLMLYRSSVHPEVCRYHHLLLHQLRLKLTSIDPGRQRRLHRTAASWFESTGDVGEAFRHLWRADERDAAMRLISGHLYDAYLANSLPTIDFILTDADILRAPGPAIGLATTLCMRLDERGSEQLADRIERLAGDRLDVVERGQMSFLRTFLAASRCDMEAVVEHADGVLSALRRDGSEGDGATSAVSMLVRAHAFAGDWAAADAAVDLIEFDGRFGVGSMELHGALANLEIFRGRLGEGIDQARRYLDLIAAHDVERLSVSSPGIAWLGCGLLEQGDTAQAEELLRRIDDADEAVRLPARTVAAVALSRLRAAQGDGDEAWRILERAWARLGHLDESSWAVAHVNAQGARLLHALGEPDRSSKLAHTLPDGVARSLALARLSVSDGDVDDAATLMSRASVQADCPRESLDVALARLSLAVRIAAPTDDLVDEVIEIASRDGFVFRLAEAGGDEFDLIRQAARRMTRTEFVEEILRTMPHLSPARPGRPSIDALSDRELAVIRHLATSMSYREIADELFISVNTLKSHVKHAFRKLGVTSRDDALARARECGYL